MAAGGDRSSRRAVCLLSGGVDSTTVLAIARDRGYACHCLSFDYGQRHRRELEAATAVAAALGAVEHRIVAVDLRAIGGSALTDDIEVPRDRKTSQMSAEIPVTYVPARNIVFLSVALGWAEVIGARDLFIGVNAIDYSGYPDCRPEFIEAFEQVAAVGTRMGVEGGSVRVHAPLIRMTKAQIIRTGKALGVDYDLTFSCYDPDPTGKACGRCDSCQLRAQGFVDAARHEGT